MKIQQIITTTGIIIIINTAQIYAQTANDLLRLSTPNAPYTTARVAGMGGAFVALGGDLGAVSQNVAGTGVFTKQHFTLGLGTLNAKNNTAYINNDTPDGASNLYLANFGYNLPIWNRERAKYPEKGLQNVNLSFTYNRTQNFRAETTLTGTNDKSSITNRFAQEANGTPEDQLTQKLPYTSALAYNAYLINPVVGSAINQYYTPIVGAVQQSQTLSELGGGKDFGINLATNYNNKLYLGVGIGFVSTEYENIQNFSEKDVLDTMRYDFKSLNFSETITTKSNGANIKAGVIFVPYKFLRLGASLQTGAKLNVTDEYATNIQSEFDNGNTYNYTPATTNNFSYICQTPLVLQIGAAFIYKEKGIFSVDLVQNNYGEMRLSASDAPFFVSQINQSIKNTYGSAPTVRLGAEYRCTPAISVRAGYAAVGSPVMNNTLNIQKQHNLSAGVGFRGSEGLYFDVAAVSSRYRTYYEPYTLTNRNLYYGALTQHNNIHILATLGARF